MGDQQHILDFDFDFDTDSLNARPSLQGQHRPAFEQVAQLLMPEARP